MRASTLLDVDRLNDTSLPGLKLLEVQTVLGGPLPGDPRSGSKPPNPSMFPQSLTGTIYQMGLKLNFNTLSFT